MLLASHLSLRFPFKCSLRRIHMETKQNSCSRGALVVLEGLDRSGKTSQSTRLLKNLNDLGYPAESLRFPDRNTSIGQMISSYLTSNTQLDDQTIHLLFSANRWEKRSYMESKLQSGTTLIVDRYSYSGVAFSSAKGLDIEWCKAPDMGLLAPDLVLYLDISPEKASERGGYGGERYEHLEFQKRVAQSYQVLRDASWKIIDANLPVEDVEKQMKDLVLDSAKTCKNGKSLSHLWSVGFIKVVTHVLSYVGLKKNSGTTDSEYPRFLLPLYYYTPCDFCSQDKGVLFPSARLMSAHPTMLEDVSCPHTLPASV